MSDEPAPVFVETLSAGPGNSRARQRDAPLLLPPQRFGDWLATLYPDPGQWRRGRLFAGPARRPRQPDGPECATRLIVVPVDIPRSGRRDDWIRFEV